MPQADLLVVGGAVGASWGGPAGWAAFMHIPALGLGGYKKLAGAVPDKTQDSVDLMTFVAAIQWYHDKFWIANTTVEVFCVSDSPELVKAGADPATREGRFDWTFITWFEERGYHLTWIWQPRDENKPVFQEAERVRSLLTNLAVRPPANSPR